MSERFIQPCKDSGEPCGGCPARNYVDVEAYLHEKAAAGWDVLGSYADSCEVQVGRRALGSDLTEVA